MRFLSTLLMFAGYTLVYAAVAAGGKFATEPWAGLFADAYTESLDPSQKQQPGAPPGPAGGLLPRQGRRNRQPGTSGVTPGGAVGRPGR